MMSQNSHRNPDVFGLARDDAIGERCVQLRAQGRIAAAGDDEVALPFVERQELLLALELDAHPADPDDVCRGLRRDGIDVLVDNLYLPALGAEGRQSRQP